MKTLKLLFKALAVAFGQFVEAGGVILVVELLRNRIRESRFRQDEYERNQQAKALASGNLDALESDIERVLSHTDSTSNSRSTKDSQRGHTSGDSNSNNVTVDGSNASIEALQREISLLLNHHGSK